MKKTYKDLQYYKFCLNCFFHSLKFYQPILLLFLKQAGLSYTQIGFLYSIKEISQNSMEIPSSLIADTYGRKFILISASLFFTLSFLVFLNFTSFQFFAVAMTFFGMAKAFRSGSHGAMINQHIKENSLEDYRLEYLAGIRGTAQIGFALGSIISGLIIFFNNNISSIFLASIFPHIFNSLLLISYPNSLNKFNHQNKKHKSNFKETIKSSIKMFKSVQLLRFFTFAALFGASFEITRDYIQIIIKDFSSSIIIKNLSVYQKTAVFLGGVYFLLYLIAAFTMKVSPILKKIKKNQTFWVNLFYLCFCLIILSIGIALNYKANGVVILLFILIFILKSLRTPMYLSSLMKRIPDKNMATGLSANHQLRSFAGAILAPLFGFIADTLNLHGAFIFLGILMLTSYFVFRIKD